jgi:hypothetical protein
MTQTPTFRDGNAVAGDLAELFGTDMTRAAGECGRCGTRTALAQTHAYLDSPGIVLRCPGCDSVLLRVVRSPSRAWLDTRGLAYLEMPVEG